MLPADAPYFFCGLPFRPHQVGRKLNWLLGLGDIRQEIKGVYVDVRVPDSAELRADAMRLLTPPEAVVCGPAAAWLHGLDTTALGPAEVVEAQWTREAPDVVEVHGVRVTSPIATAVELAMRLPRPFALSAVDALLRSGKADLFALRAASSAYGAATRIPPRPGGPAVGRSPRRLPCRVLAPPPPDRRRLRPPRPPGPRRRQRPHLPLGCRLPRSAC